MDAVTAVELFDKLSSPVRLAIYRLLVQRGTNGLVAGEIARTVGLSPSNVSFHLKALTEVGMLHVVQEGRFWRYRANIPQMLALIAYLTEACCEGNPQACLDYRQASNCHSAVLPDIIG